MAHGLVNTPAGSILLRVGDNVTTTPNSQILAGQNIDIYGDFARTTAPVDVVGADDSPKFGTVMHLPGVIAEAFGLSRSEARRLIDQGGVTLGDAPLAAGEHDVPLERADGQVLKVGRRRFRRLRAG